MTKDLTGGGDKLPELKDGKTSQTKTMSKTRATAFPAEDRMNPFINQSFEAFNTKNIQLSKTFPV